MSTAHCWREFQLTINIVEGIDQPTHQIRMLWSSSHALDAHHHLPTLFSMKISCQGGHYLDIKLVCCVRPGCLNPEPISDQKQAIFPSLFSELGLWNPYPFSDQHSSKLIPKWGWYIPITILHFNMSLYKPGSDNSNLFNLPVFKVWPSIIIASSSTVPSSVR